MTLFVDQAALRAEAANLTQLSSGVDGAAGSLPSGVEGGVGTAAILGIFTVFTDGGGQLVTALAGTGDTLTGCLTSYSQQDDATAESLGAAAWAE